MKVDDKKIEEMQKQIDDLTNNWKRALADYQNLAKRTNEEKEIFGKFANAVMIEKMLPVVDALEKAVEHTKDEGVNLALKQFKQILKDFGVVEMDIANKEFDPNTSECIEVVQGENDNKVVCVLVNGYMIHGKVLRPAKVKVSKKNVQSEEKEPKTASSDTKNI